MVIAQTNPISYDNNVLIFKPRGEVIRGSEEWAENLYPVIKRSVPVVIDCSEITGLGERGIFELARPKLGTGAHVYLARVSAKLKEELKGRVFSENEIYNSVEEAVNDHLKTEQRPRVTEHGDDIFSYQTWGPIDKSFPNYTRRMTDDGMHVVLDMTHNTKIDSAGMGGLIAMRIGVGDQGRKLVTCNRPPAIAKSITMAQLTGVIRNYDSVDEAVEGIRTRTPLQRSQNGGFNFTEG